MSRVVAWKDAWSAVVLVNRLRSRLYVMSKRQIFLSHALADKPLLAERLHRALLEQDLTVWYDDAAVSWGDSIPLSIQKGLRDSEFVLILLTPNFTQSEQGWRYEELSTALTQQVAGTQTRILPLVWGLSHDELLRRIPLLAARRYREIPDGVDGAVLSQIAREVADTVHFARRTELLTRTEVDRQDPVRDRLRSARTEVSILGNDCKLVVESLSALVNEALVRGVKVNVLCVDPEGPGAETLAVWDERFASAEAFRASMRSVEGSLRELDQRHRGLQVRYAPFAPSFGLFIVDPGLPTSSAKVEIYTVKPFRERPHFFVPYGPWQDFFVSQWDNIWSLSRPPNWSFDSSASAADDSAAGQQRT